MPNTNKHTVGQGQTLFDIAIQKLGDAACAMQIALANDIEVTADLNTGDEVIIPDVETTTAQDKIVTAYTKNNIVPAGALPV